MIANNEGMHWIYPQGYPQGALYKTLVLYRFAVFLLFFSAVLKLF